jgi:predicted  nucleic acid-binding Zn-ribbon protein
MTDTPRTDAAACDGTTVPADFAADLEREIAELKAEVERLRDELDRLKEAIPAVLTHIDDIGARGYYSGKTLEEDAAIEVLRAALKETK